MDSQKSEVFSKKVRANRDNLQALLDFIEESLDLISCANEIKFKLLIASEEILVNIVDYAYSDDIGEIEIKLIKTHNEIEMVFIDQGQPYNPLMNTNDPRNLALEDRVPGGLGIIMVKEFMDHVEYGYEEQSNILKLRKKIKQ